MIVRLVADIQNRLFWRVGTGRASECCVSSAGWSQVSRDGHDVPAEQRLQGFEPLVAADRVVLIAATSPSQQKGRCPVRTNVGSADGYRVFYFLLRYSADLRKPAWPEPGPGGIRAGGTRVLRKEGHLSVGDG